MRIMLGVVMASVIVASSASTAEVMTAEQEAVRRVVQEAYVDGIHNYRRVEAVRAGFHPGFEMLILKDGKLSKLAIASWIENLERANATNPIPPDAPAGTQARFPLIDVTGDAALAKVELSRGGALVFTDYLMLYRFPEGWRIVGKAFHRH